MRMTALAFLTLVLLLAACGDKSSENNIDIQGRWGGEHIGLLVLAENSTVEFDCATGTIDEPINLEDEGRFEVQGTVTPGTPVEIAGGPPPEARPATYGGAFNGDVLTLTVMFLDTGEELGTFTLNRGDEGRLFRCL